MQCLKSIRCFIFLTAFHADVITISRNSQACDFEERSDEESAPKEVPLRDVFQLLIQKLQMLRDAQDDNTITEQSSKLIKRNSFLSVIYD